MPQLSAAAKRAAQEQCRLTNRERAAEQRHAAGVGKRSFWRAFDSVHGHSLPDDISAMVGEGPCVYAIFDIEPLTAGRTLHLVVDLSGSIFESPTVHVVHHDDDADREAALCVADAMRSEWSPAASPGAALIMLLAGIRREAASRSVS